jgi:MFS family permease
VESVETPESAVERRPGLWHHADFRRLWIGETVSQFGSAISQLALPLVAILTLHASTFEVGALTAVQMSAFLVVGLPAGALVDRMRFRVVLIVNDAVRAVALASIPLAAGFGVLGIGQLYVVALVTSVSTVFFDVAYQSYLPELVTKDELVDGNAKLQASESVSQIAGPGLGGLIVQALTAPYAVLVDAVSFAWSGGWIAAIRARPAKPAPSADRHLGREIAEGLAFVVRNPILRAITACTALWNFFAAIGMAVFYVLLARTLHLSAGVIGAIDAVSAVGGLLGSLVAARVAARLGQGPAIWVSILVAAPTGLVAPFLHRDWTLGLLVLSQLVFWASTVVYNVTQVSFRQAVCPPHLLGRMNATIRFVVWGVLPLGGLLGGVLGATIGVRATLFIVGLGGFLPVLPVVFSPLRRARELLAYDGNGA